MTLSSLVSSAATHLWETTLVVALVWVALHTALRRLPSRLRFALLLTASVKFVLPFGVLSAIGATLASRVPLPEMESAPLTAVGQFVTDVTSITISAAYPAGVMPEPTMPLPLLLLVWLAGTAVILVRWCAEWLHVARILPDARWVATHDGVDVFESAALRDAGCEPGVFGVLEPVVLVPAGIAEHLTPAQLDAVLAHECCHVRRRDNLTAALHALIEAMFWFHPLVWWLGRRLRVERERACDDAVLRRGVDSTAYAEGILTICRLYVEPRLTAVAAVTGADLRRRIERIVAGALEPPVTHLHRLLIGAAATLVVLAPIAHGVIGHAQQAADGAIARMDTTDTFDVASVKQNISGDGQRGIGFQPGGRFRARNMTVRGIIAAAYGTPQPLPMFRIIGGPNWIDAERYDVDAAASSAVAGTLTPPWPPRGQSMLRALLIDRFKLAARLETQNLPAYELVMARSGSTLGRRLRVSDGTDCASPAAANSTAPATAPTQISCGGFRVTPPEGLSGRSLTMDQFARFLTLNIVERPVINRTGLTGSYSWDLEFARELTAAAGRGVEPPATTSPSIFTALSEQLGLRLAPTTTPLEVVVVDSISRPTPN